MLQSFSSVISSHRWHPTPCRSSLASSIGWVSLTRHGGTPLLKFVHQRRAGRPPLPPLIVPIKSCHVGFAQVIPVLGGHSQSPRGASDTPQQCGLREADFCVVLLSWANIGSPRLPDTDWRWARVRFVIRMLGGTGPQWGSWGCSSALTPPPKEETSAYATRS